MRNIVFTFRQHIKLIRLHPVAAIVILSIFLAIAVYVRHTHQVIHAIAYFFAVWLCMFITDLVVNANPKQTTGFPVKKPLKKELLTIIGCTALGFAFLIIRFFTHWETLNGLVKLSALPLILFAFPIVLAIIYLFWFKYKPKELGVNLNYWYLAVFIHIVFGCITLWIIPERSHWKEMYHQMGLLDMLFTGLVTAALSEEFTRMLLQTRLNKYFKNNSVGFILAAVIWAMMHIPTFAQNDKRLSIPALFGALNIVPLGLLWGYITHRTKSVLPSVLLHGFNLWGLQNF